MVQSSSAAANSFFDLTSAFENDVLGLDGKITESSNEFADFENFELKGSRALKRCPPYKRQITTGSVLL